MAHRLHKLRGTGYASRFRISATDLSPGWRQEQKSHKYTVWYDDKGKRYKSSEEVERAIRAREPQEPPEACTTTDACETSEFEPSPVKRARGDP